MDETQGSEEDDDFLLYDEGKWCPISAKFLERFKETDQDAMKWLLHQSNLILDQRTGTLTAKNLV